MTQARPRRASPATLSFALPITRLAPCLTSPSALPIKQIETPPTYNGTSQTLTANQSPTKPSFSPVFKLADPNDISGSKMTWKTDSTGNTTSSKASSLFGLDEEDRTNILVYKYRSGCKALDVTTQQELCKNLDSDPNLAFTRVTKKKIPRGNSRLEIHTEDILMPEDLQRYADKPTLKASLANVGLPSSAYWKRLLFNSFPELYIVSRSPTPTPESSTHNSPESSQHVSPAGTFPRDNAHPLQDPQAS